MFRKRARLPRKLKVYRIPVETYVALGIAFALSVALSLLSRPGEVSYRLPHRFAVDDPTFVPSAHALTNPATVPGNRVSLLVNGDEIFPAMLAAIRAARTTIAFESYIFWSGKIASEFEGSRSSSFGNLLSGGVRIFEYEPTMFRPKTMVVDGLFATVGSTNFDGPFD